MEPIAIIGIGCRFPGANSPETFWDLLCNGSSAIVEVPPDRWDINALYAPEPATPGKMNTRFGGFIDAVDQFDPSFFGISPREAERMDPQQRLVLEVAWESLENAGIVPADLSGSQTGVFIGCGNFDYALLLSKKGLSSVSPYDGTGSTIGISANRLSYLLNLRGPSLAIETACSSSLVALHLAAQSLRNAESNLCIVGAISLMLSPEQTITYSQARMMASDGRCKTFDASADGYVRGEGCGIVVLKRLSDALRDGDRIQAVIRGTAVNQDGLSNGLTAPNGPAQQAVIRQALENAEVKPSQISYVETHGTGTSLGDPIEVRSLKTVLMQGRQPDQPCWIGSVKTNVGHLEAAAGMVGLLKVVLSLQHGKIPPHLNLNQLNPLISFEGTPFSIPTQLQDWDLGEERRFAGVSSFGFGGTNAHVILEDAPCRQVLTSTHTSETTELAHTSAALIVEERPFHVLTLSAKSEPALQQMALQYEAFLASHPSLSLTDVCFTANIGRSQFEHRLAIVTDSVDHLRQQLRAFAHSEQSQEWIEGQVTNRKSPKIAFLFTGQGSQYVEMGRSLYEAQPVFRQALDECNTILRADLNPPLLEVLYPSNGAGKLLNETAYTQPALFALEYALYKLWQSWGIEPTAVMGHSVGEYVAACVAGVFSLEDALKLIAARGRLMQSLPTNGSMMAVMASLEQVKEQIAPHGGKVAIAAMNGPKNVVISGQQQAIEQVCQAFNTIGVKTTPLRVSHPFHSPLMEPMIEAFSKVAQSVSYSSPRIRFISNVTGKVATDEVTSAGYWCRHILQPVNFAEGMQTIVEQKCTALLEIGAKPILLGMGRQCLDSTEADRLLWLPSLRPGQPDWRSLLQSLATLAVQGAAINWKEFDRPYSCTRVALPTYPFQRQRYWIDNEQNEQRSNKPEDSNIAQTRIVEWLNQGNTDALIQEFAVGLSTDEDQSLSKFVQMLVSKHQQEVAATVFQNWFYHLEWQCKTDAISSAPIPSDGSWLIFANRGGIGESLANCLRQEGQSCFLVYVGYSYQRRDPETWYLNPVQADDYSSLFQDLAATQKLSSCRVIHLWSLEASKPETLSVSDLEQAQQLGCGSVMQLVKALTHQSGAARLWLVTRGATPADATSPTVAQAPLWALGRVIALEHPEYWGGMVDLAPVSSSDEASLLLAAIADAQGENQIALRSDQRYVARLVPSQPAVSQRLKLASDASYLITGGLGALGLRVAQWLVEQDVRNLILLGRRGASPEAQDKILALEQAGARVWIAQADVTQEADMIQVLESAKATMPPIRGIVHAAGAVGYQPLAQMDSASFEAVLRPKVIGAWLLHRLTQDMPLDFFVMFSSIAATWGSKGQAHYAAANHFLDALAHYRQAMKLPALSVNWGPWADGGMATEEAQQWLTRMGIKVLQPESALAALGHLMSASSTQVTVADVDWQIFKSFYEARGQHPMLAELATTSNSTEAPKLPKSQILDQLNAASQNDRLSLLNSYLQTEIAKVLGLGANRLPDLQCGFFDMGMDSLMAVELRSRLEVSFSTDLPATLAFEAPTIQDLAAYLSREVLGWTTSEAEEEAVISVQAEPASNGSELDDEWLSEEDIDASIAERLAKLESLMRAN